MRQNKKIMAPDKSLVCWFKKKKTAFMVNFVESFSSQRFWSSKINSHLVKCFFKLQTYCNCLRKRCWSLQWLVCTTRCQYGDALKRRWRVPYVKFVEFCFCCMYILVLSYYQLIFQICIINHRIYTVNMFMTKI